jgi:biopolymer transport protein TolR
MAVSLNGGKGRGRYRPLSEINVTPLVDVMLVLLIIFMVTAPLMSSAVNIDLPKVSATPVSQDSEPLKVQVDAQGGVFLQDEQIELPELVAKLQAIAKDQKDRRIFVRGDKANSYGRMLEVMSTIIQGGFTKVALMTDPSGTQSSPATPAAAPAGAPAGAVPAAPASGASSSSRPAVPAVAPAPAPGRPATRPSGRG